MNPQQTVPPALPVFLTGEWRWLAMINYEIDPAILRSLIPHGVELDEYNGRHFVSMVGFRFLSTKVFGFRFPFHVNFDEVNLRFYVRKREADGTWRRGVVFVREIVPRLAIATIARLWYNEPYIARPMRHRLEQSNERISTRYEWKFAGRWNHLSIESKSAESSEIAAGSEEEFITEHYWGYTPQRDGSTLEYQVEHPRWRMWKSVRHEFDCDVRKLYGEPFVSVLAAEPSSAFIAEGSPVSIRRGAGIGRPDRT